MACPYFMPVTKLENGNWPHPARLPLGTGWSGHCTAAGHENQTPAQHVLETFCNLGYASGCNWAPQKSLRDAIRFAVSAPPVLNESQATATVPPRVLRLRYVCEQNHQPVEHGDLEYDLSGATWLRRHDDVRIQKMAECFLDSYLKKTA